MVQRREVIGFNDLFMWRFVMSAVSFINAITENGSAHLHLSKQSVQMFGRIGF